MAITKYAFKKFSKTFDYSSVERDIHKHGRMCSRCFGLKDCPEDEKNDVLELYHDKQIVRCNCGKTHTNYFEIDTKIFKTIQVLNRKGYETYMCCQGYVSDGPSAFHGFISFRKYYDFDIYEIPDIVAVEDARGKRRPYQIMMECEVSEEEMREVFPNIKQLKQKKQEDFVLAMEKFAGELPDINERNPRIAFDSGRLESINIDSLPFKITIEKTGKGANPTIEVICTEYSVIDGKKHAERKMLFSKQFVDNNPYF